MRRTVSEAVDEIRLAVDEWIRKLWYIYTMEYYSAIKKNTFESVLNKVDETGAYYTELK